MGEFNNGDEVILKGSDDIFVIIGINQYIPVFMGYFEGKGMMEIKPVGYALYNKTKKEYHMTYVEEKLLEKFKGMIK